MIEPLPKKTQKEFEHKMASPVKQTKMQIQLCCIYMTDCAAITDHSVHSSKPDITVLQKLT